jgi:hypothetical protein
MVAVLVCSGAPWTQGASSSKTAEVRIIIPERPAASSTPNEPAHQPEVFPAPSAPSMVRTTTLIQDGEAIITLHTETPPL